MVAIKLLAESFVLPPDIPASGRGERRTGYYSLFITAKRYRVRASEKKKAFQNDADAITLLALHSTSFSKEVWEPTLEALFQVLEERNNSTRVKIREVWAVDCPNHGHAGVLNREVLEREAFAPDCEYLHWLTTDLVGGGDIGQGGCEHYAMAVHRFLQNAPKIFGIYFSKRKLVGLGHSLGANTLWVCRGAGENLPIITARQITFWQIAVAKTATEFSVLVTHHRGAHRQHRRWPWSGSVESQTRAKCQEEDHWVAWSWGSALVLEDETGCDGMGWTSIEGLCGLWFLFTQHPWLLIAFF